jgi:hypothetical protein
LEKGGERACEWLICGFIAGLGRVNKSRNCHQVERGPRKVKFGSIGWGEPTKIIFLLVFSKTDESYFDHRSTPFYCSDCVRFLMNTVDTERQ